jgi:hypothetical protein
MIAPLPSAATLLAAALAATVAAPAAPAGTSATPDTTFATLPLDAKVEGRGYPELAEAWWRWAYRQRDGMRPTQDPTGAQCHVGQTGTVWFLAGTPGTGTANRRCTVPEGRHLFLPVHVALEYSVPGRRRDCATLRTAAGEVASRPLSYRVELDGAPLAPVRSASRDCFDAYADADHDEVPPGLYAPASTDGLWLLLPPLPKGPHRLVVEARQTAAGAARSRFDQQFTYTLDVGGEPVEADGETPPPDDEAEEISL